MSIAEECNRTVEKIYANSLSLYVSNSPKRFLYQMGIF